MKQLLILVVFLLLSFKGYEQAASDCNMTWEKPATALLNTKGNVSYNIQFSKCTSSGICGWPKVSISHTFSQPAIIGITLRGLGCDGQTVTSSFSTEAKPIRANDDFISQGNWHTFKQVTGVVRVEVSYEENGNKYHILVDKDRNINTTTINGMTVAEFNAAQQKQSTPSVASSKNSATVNTSAATGNRPVVLSVPAGESQQAAQGSSTPPTINTATRQTGANDPIKEGAASAIDNYLVDKDKVKNDPYAAAQLANARAAVNATSYADQTKYGTLAFSNSLIGGINELANRKREAKAQLQKEMQEHLLKAQGEVASIDQKLQQAKPTTEEENKNAVRLIASGCKPLATVFYKGSDRVFFDAASLSDKILGQDDIDRVNKIFKTVKHDPGDDAAFDAARIYILGDNTWRLKGSGKLEFTEIPKDKAKAQEILAAYKNAKSSQQSPVKQIRADYATVLLEESFEPKNEANLLQWQKYYDELLTKLSGNVTSSKQLPTDDDPVNLLISIQLKQFYTRCKLYLLNPQLGSYENIYKDYQTLKTAIIGY